MFRYKNTTLYNLMKINYVYVIHYVDHLFVIRHCDEADELLAICVMSLRRRKQDRNII